MAEQLRAEAIRQSLHTLRSIATSVGLLPHQAVGEGGSSTGGSSVLPESEGAEQRRYWAVGQWVDCLDTVAQWLEARILCIDGPNLFVHYNGWAVRGEGARAELREHTHTHTPRARTSP